VGTRPTRSGTATMVSQMYALLTRRARHVFTNRGKSIRHPLVAVCGTSATGNALGAKIYMPYEVDCTVQVADSWFYSAAAGYKSIVELASQYHDSVGHGGNLLLNLAPPTDTVIPAKAMELYAQLGNWSRRCYGEGGVASKNAIATTTTACRNCTSIKLLLPVGPRMVDRFLIKEELEHGQRIQAFEIRANGGALVYNGSAVGSAHIALLGHNVTAREVELKITATRGGPATVRLFAVPDPAACWLPPAGGNCSVVPNTLYTTQTPLKTLSTATVQGCCDACRDVPVCSTNRNHIHSYMIPSGGGINEQLSPASHALLLADLSQTCAVFTAVLGTHWPYTLSCQLMGAMTGERSLTGAISGSPVR
jgi:hypothetical protein